MQRKAVLEAVPSGGSLDRDVNGIDVGAGSLVVHHALIPIDIQRNTFNTVAAQKTSTHTPFAWGDELPFKNSSLDVIVSLHNMEHLHDPVSAVTKYLNILRPGGGLGVVIPNANFIWTAELDDNQWGHRSNFDPAMICCLYHKHGGSSPIWSISPRTKRACLLTLFFEEKEIGVPL
jgi:SAM-dependent methyltransferase